MPKRTHPDSCELQEEVEEVPNKRKRQATLINCVAVPRAKTPSIFRDCLSVTGLVYITNFITTEEETNILAQLDNGEWSTVLKRRVQHFGYIYDYKSRSVSDEHKIGDLPSWSEPLFDRLREMKICSKDENSAPFWQENPTQLIVNEYLPGQGIAAHIDNMHIFGDPVVSISLGSDIAMDLSCGEVKHSIFLQRRSLLLLSDEARYNWKHGIAARKRDKNVKKITTSGIVEMGVERGRRVSLTFRHMLKKKSTPVN